MKMLTMKHCGGSVHGCYMVFYKHSLPKKLAVHRVLYPSMLTFGYSYRIPLV